MWSSACCYPHAGISTWPELMSCSSALAPPHPHSHPLSCITHMLHSLRHAASFRLRCLSAQRAGTRNSVLVAATAYPVKQQQPVCGATASPQFSSSGVALASSPLDHPVMPSGNGTSSVAESLRAIEGMLGPLDNSPLVPPPKPVVVVISGPSGVGKDTVVARLKELREDLYFVVTATSRPKRPAEVEGRDYFFVTKEKFEQWIQEDMLLEHALVYGDYKGIPRQQVDDALKQGTDVVLRIDVQGAATVKQLIPDAITIFVAAESEATLVRRLVERKTETPDKMAVRMATARAELARVREFDYVVINGTGALERCVAQVSGIIDAEKARVKNRYQGHTQQQQQQ